MNRYRLSILLASLLTPHAVLASGYVTPSAAHGYRPHQRPRRHKAPYRGNLGRRH